jgi:hypothetical protein
MSQSGVRGVLLECRKNPTYTFIKFQENFPPTQLFGPTFFSDLHFYSFSRIFPSYTLLFGPTLVFGTLEKDFK